MTVEWIYSIDLCPNINDTIILSITCKLQLWPTLSVRCHMSYRYSLYIYESLGKGKWLLWPKACSEIVVVLSDGMVHVCVCQKGTHINLIVRWFACHKVMLWYFLTHNECNCNTQHKHTTNITTMVMEHLPLQRRGFKNPRRPRGRRPCAYIVQGSWQRNLLDKIN